MFSFLRVVLIVCRKKGLRQTPSMFWDFDKQPVKCLHRCRCQVAPAALDTLITSTRKFTELGIFEWVRWDAVDPCFINVGMDHWNGKWKFLDGNMINWNAIFG